MQSNMIFPDRLLGNNAHSHRKLSSSIPWAWSQVRYYQEGWFNLAEDRRTILITGDASGICRATAELFAARGWFVGGFDVDSKGLATLRSSINDGIFEPLDVSDRAAVVRFGDQTDGRLDLLFNNAGINAKGAFSDMPWEAIARVVSVNFLGGMGLIQAAFPLLAATAKSLCLTTASASAILAHRDGGLFRDETRAQRTDRGTQRRVRGSRYPGCRPPSRHHRYRHADARG